MKGHPIKYFVLVLMFALSVEPSIAQQDTIRSFPYFNGFEDASSLNYWSNEGAFDWSIDQSTSHPYNGSPSIGSLFADGMLNTSGTEEERTAAILSPVFAF
ncbi:MAG: hypothetical protein AAGC88_15320 [Bacteroidota bacterium]